MKKSRPSSALITSLFVAALVLLPGANALGRQAPSGGTSSAASPTPEANNTQTPTPAPAAPRSEPAAPRPDAEASTAAPATSAGRLAALLTPEKRNPVKLVKFDKAPVIDGKLDEEVWKRAAVFKDFIQHRPGDLTAPTKPTEVYIGYDSKFLYVAFHAFDEPDKVRATVAKRDNIFSDDWVGLMFDTFNDGRRAYEAFFNPLGVQADAVFNEGMNEDFSVDIVMDSKGSITSDGFVVEVAIPFKSLRYTAGEGKQWKLHLFRCIQRFNGERSAWMPISRDNSSFLGQAGHIAGLVGVSNERTLEIIPSITFSQTGKRVNSFVPGSPEARAGIASTDADRFLNKPAAADIGVTAKYNLTPEVTLNFAYNPDFAQVEADAAVVTANQRFPIFFEEKRPFFLEGKEIFETLISAVHTRTIVDPDYAAKLTGKRGRNTFGLLFASDNAPGNLDDDDRDFILANANSANPGDISKRNALLKVLDRNSTVGILRLKRDIGKEDHLGFLATTSHFVDRYNTTAGFDGRYRFNKTTVLLAQVLGSVTNRPFFYAEEGKTFDRREQGLAYAYNLDSSGRNWGWNYSGVGRSRFFRADVGFNRRFNTNSQNLFVRYRSGDKPKAKIVNWRAYNAAGGNFDWKGRTQFFNNETQLQLNLQRQSFVGVGVERGYERVFESEFGPTRGARARESIETFGAARASTLPPCDPTGTMAAVIPDDPSTPDKDESRFLGHCTFSGSDPERSARRNTLYFFGGTTPSKKFSLFLLNVLNYGSLDFDFGAGPRFPRVSPAALAFGQDAPRDPGRGREWKVEGRFSFQPTDALRMDLSYNKARLVRDDTGRVAFDDQIYSLRSTYQFTRFWFARARADYTTLASQLRMQYLLGWTPNPGTAFYAGYNDDLNHNGFNPFNGALEPGFRRNGRVFFVKMSYLFRRSVGE